jgi:hypothetical protein
MELTVLARAAGNRLLARNIDAEFAVGMRWDSLSAYSAAASSP